MHTDSILNLNFGKIFVRHWQPTTISIQDPLILLHDSLGCVELWRDFPATLAHKLRRPVLAYDRLGFGLSNERKERPTRDFIREEAEEYLPIILRELSIVEFCLFGHSVGGAMALMTASRMGDRCKAVVSESAQAFVEDCTITGITNARLQFQKPEQFERLRRWHGEKAQWVLDAWTEVWLSHEFASWTLEPDLPSVSCPVLVIHGDADEFGSVSFPEMIGRLVTGPVDVQILKNCGHVPHREQPEVVIDLVFRFPPLSAPVRDQ